MASRLNHLLLVSTEELFNPKAWSGIPNSLRAALERQTGQVTSFQPPRPRRTLLASALRLLFGAHRYPLWISRATLRANAGAVQQEIDRVKPDAVLSISSQCVVDLEAPGVPVFLFSDAPYQAFLETYARWETAPRPMPRFARQEAAAGHRLDGLCFGSAWACAEAARLYGLSSSEQGKLHVTPLGANWVPPLTREHIFARIDARTFDTLQFLFVGRDWERKGGPLAVETVSALRSRGVEAQLHIVGCRPALDPAAAGYVTVHGALYQTDPAESARLAELFLNSHFLLVPTLAECFGIVFAEAQAFGLPPISRAIDALPSIVDDGATGLLFEQGCTADQYAERIAALVARPDEYRAMARAARVRFEDCLTWDDTARGILQAITLRLEAIAGDIR